MKILGIVLGLAAIAAVVPSCHSTKPVIQPVQDCFGYEKWGYWTYEAPPSVTVCTDGSKPRILQFKGADGVPVPGGGFIQAPGCLNIPYPPGGVSVDWLETPREEGQHVIGEKLLTAVSHGDIQAGAGEYVFGCAPLKASSDDIARTYEIAVQATSLAEAEALVMPVAYFPTASSLPPNVTVHFHLETQLENGAVVIRSSLADKFDVFQIDVNGQRVADLASGLNVEVTHPGNRWTMVVATLPLDLLSESMMVELEQKGHSDPNELWKVLTF